MSAKQFTQNIANDGALRRRIFRIFLSSFVVLSLCYVYLIGSITFNILARKSLEVRVAEMERQVNNLEVSFLAQANTIDMSFGALHGFVESKGTLFASKDTTTVALR